MFTCSSSHEIPGKIAGREIMANNTNDERKSINPPLSPPFSLTPGPPVLGGWGWSLIRKIRGFLQASILT